VPPTGAWAGEQSPHSHVSEKRAILHSSPLVLARSNTCAVVCHALTSRRASCVNCAQCAPLPEAITRLVYFATGAAVKLLKPKSLSGVDGAPRKKPMPGLPSLNMASSTLKIFVPFTKVVIVVPMI